jgi:hypothetical protein
MTKSEPSRNPSFLKFILRFRGPRKIDKHSPVRKQLPQLPAQSVLSSAFMAKIVFKITRIWLGTRFNGYRWFKLKYGVEDRVLKNKNG